MVKLEVKVTGHPMPERKWFKEGEEIVPSDEFQIENLDDGTSILVINDVYPDDTGVIKFEAVNSVGKAESTTEFVVEGNLESFHKSFTAFKQFLPAADIRDLQHFLFPIISQNIFCRTNVSSIDVLKSKLWKLSIHIFYCSFYFFRNHRNQRLQKT